MGMERLYDYYLHYNQYTGYWTGVKRGETNDYHNGTLDPKKIFRNKDVNELIKSISIIK